MTMKLKNKSSVDFYSETNFEICQKTIVISALMSATATTETYENFEEKTSNLTSNKNQLLKKFFKKWKDQCTQAKTKSKNSNSQIEKIDDFLNMLKRKKEKSKVVLRQSNNVNYKHKKSSKQESECFRYRFEAQKDIIQLQKHKLSQQEKLIQDLKLKTITEEVNLSLHETQKLLRETIQNCSVRVKCQIGMPVKISNEKFRLNVDQAPKIMREMQEKATERAIRRQEIIEKKREMEEKKKENLKYVIEMKRALEEEERKKMINQIMERRNRELEVQNKIRMKQQKLIEDCKKADDFRTKCLKKLVIRTLKNSIRIRNNNLAKSKQFYEISLVFKCWKKWSNIISAIWNEKYSRADEYYENKLKRNTFKVWLEIYKVQVQNLQVAEDWYNVHLESRILINWHEFARDQLMLYLSNLQKARQHYQNHLLLNYLYRWKLLPTIVQLEKKKEYKKQKWREKVWEIVPDYKPLRED